MAIGRPPGLLRTFIDADVGFLVVGADALARHGRLGTRCQGTRMKIGIIGASFAKAAHLPALRASPIDPVEAVRAG